MRDLELWRGPGPLRNQPRAAGLRMLGCLGKAGAVRLRQLRSLGPCEGSAAALQAALRLRVLAPAGDSHPLTPSGGCVHLHSCSPVCRPAWPSPAASGSWRPTGPARPAPSPAPSCRMQSREEAGPRLRVILGFLKSFLQRAPTGHVWATKNDLTLLGRPGARGKRLAGRPGEPHPPLGLRARGCLRQHRTGTAPAASR